MENVDVLMISIGIFNPTDEPPAGGETPQGVWDATKENSDETIQIFPGKQI